VPAVGQVPFARFNAFTEHLFILYFLLDLSFFSGYTNCIMQKSYLFQTLPSLLKAASGLCVPDGGMVIEHRKDIFGVARAPIARLHGVKDIQEPLKTL